jgi:hypothetical protein
VEYQPRPEECLTQSRKVRKERGVVPIPILLEASLSQGIIPFRMNLKTLLAFIIMLASTLVASPAQEAQPSQQTQPLVAAPDQIVVNVLGEVSRPARIILPKGGTLLDAIASTGGITRLGNPSRTTLIHKSAGAKPDSTRIDLKPILMGVAKDITLKDGDTVVIGQTLF